MNNEKRVILFIVEGNSDRIFFSEYQKLFPDYHVLIHVVKGDIFSNRDLKNQSIKTVVQEIVKKVLRENPVKGLLPTDIAYIFQITDTDCCFQDDQFSNYSLDVIRKAKANKINDVIAMQQYMSNLEYKKYKLLYFSPNLEGALTPSFDPEGKHGGHKQNNMLKLVASMRHHHKGFEYALNQKLNNRAIAPFDEYFESWEFIRETNNSQGNFTNLKFTLREEKINSK